MFVEQIAFLLPYIQVQDWLPQAITHNSDKHLYEFRIVMHIFMNLTHIMLLKELLIMVPLTKTKWCAVNFLNSWQYLHDILILIVWIQFGFRQDFKSKENDRKWMNLCMELIMHLMFYINLTTFKY